MARKRGPRSSPSIASAASSSPKPQPKSKRGPKPSDPVVARALALLTPLGPVTARAMFGGHGLYLEGRIFAIIAWDRLYFRTDAETKADFARAGGAAFVYEGRGKAVEMPYSTAPEAAMSSAETLLPWAELAVAASRRVAQAKARRKR